MEDQTIEILEILALGCLGIAGEYFITSYPGSGLMRVTLAMFMAGLVISAMIGLILIARNHIGTGAVKIGG